MFLVFLGRVRVFFWRKEFVRIEIGFRCCILGLVLGVFCNCFMAGIG